MQINPLDAHDRLKEFIKKDFSISECCQNLIDQRPFGNRPFYIFAHGRIIDLDERIAILNASLHGQIDQKYFSLNEVPTDRLLWQPRLTKPKAQTNSMLYKAHPGTDIVRIIWIIPKPELWGEYRKGNMMQNKTVYDSITDFNHNRKKLEMDEDEDPTDEEASRIYQEISQEAKSKKMMDKLWKI